MKKRTLALAALTAAMTLGMSLTSFAAEEPTWIVPKGLSAGEYQSTYGTSTWYVAEGVADCRAWAEANKGDIVGIQDEMARYTAIVNKVCGFLTYDINYKNPHIAYTIRDKKGVCSDYTALTLALCEKCNIKAVMSEGSLNGVEHNMVKVTINGSEYYSDPTNYESGVVGILGMTPGYTELSCGGGLVSANYCTGSSTSMSDIAVWSMDAEKTAPANTTPVKNKSGNYVYIPNSELADAENGKISFVDLFTKYGVYN